MREDLILILCPPRCHSDYFMTFVEIVVSFVIVVGPFSRQAHHSLHCIRGSQMDVPLETLFGSGMMAVFERLTSKSGNRLHLQPPHRSSHLMSYHSGTHLTAQTSI